MLLGGVCHDWSRHEEHALADAAPGLNALSHGYTDYVPQLHISYSSQCSCSRHAMHWCLDLRNYYKAAKQQQEQNITD